MRRIEFFDFFYIIQLNLGMDLPEAISNITIMSTGNNEAK